MNNNLLQNRGKRLQVACVVIKIEAMFEKRKRYEEEI